ncbi:MAG TPA: hypothetical protein DIC31_08370, partial [Rhizobiales bacterium]|nr:hypothetical protein [Hyphomicrobiales bacterium]
AVCVHWFRIDGPVGELYDLGVVPGVVRPMALGFATTRSLASSPTTRSPRAGPLSSVPTAC